MMTRTLKASLVLFAMGVSVGAHAAAPLVTDISMVPRLTVQGEVGAIHQIQYSSDLSQTNWTAITNLVVTQSPYWFVDVTAPPSSRRFYRVQASGIARMRFVSAGTFEMGDNLDSMPDSIPVHTVYVGAFYMDTNLVSFSFWQQVYQWAMNHGYVFDNQGSGKAATHPVQSINWYDCVKWCNARSEMEGRVPAYYTSSNQTSVYRMGTNDITSECVNWSSGYRLPTEAEWEKAARGGLSGKRFPWGDTITQNQANYYSDAAWSYDVNPTQGFHPAFAQNGAPYTSPVGYFAPNAYGLYDMAGNVYAWCWDFHGPYSSVSQTDPHGPSASSFRIFRGGGWSGDAYYCRTAVRDIYAPATVLDCVGLRCVLSLGE